jgi:hypothetical protein
MRTEWVAKRENDTVRTQMYYAKAGYYYRRDGICCQNRGS